MYGLCCVRGEVVGGVCKIIIGRDVMFFFFQAEDGRRDLVRSRGLGDVYKRQTPGRTSDSRSKTITGDNSPVVSCTIFQTHR